MSTIVLSETIELGSISRPESTPPDASDGHLQQSPPPSSHQAVDEFPEGGYGWVVVAACSTLTFFVVGLSYSWGVLQTRLASEGLAPAPTLAFIGSLAVSFVSTGAIINARIIRYIGSKPAALLACCLMGFGQILSGFATQNVGALFFTNGVLVGLGYGLGFMSFSTMPAQYFRKKRGIANGFVFAGGGIGGAVLSVLMNALLTKVGLAWTFRIIGCLTLAVSLPACMFLRERTRRPPSSIEWPLFKDPKFICLFLGTGIAAFPLLVPPFFIPMYAASLGISDTLSSILLAVFNLSSAVGRVGFGFSVDKIGPVNSLLLTLLVSAISMLSIWPVSSSLAPLLVFIIINGMGNGGFFSVVPSVVGHIYGASRVPAAYAMTVSAWAGGYILGPPVAGYILAQYGGSEAGRAAFRPAMYYAGSMSLGGAGFVYAIRRLMTHKLFTYV